MGFNYLSLQTKHKNQSVFRQMLLLALAKNKHVAFLKYLCLGLQKICELELGLSRLS